jgi:hypothetical protein
MRWQLARPTDNPAGKKSAPIAIRLSPGLREHLEKARQESGSSMSREIERRLIDSFQMDQKCVEEFGSMFNYRLFRMMADGFKQLEYQCKGNKLWEDRFVFNQSKIYINTILNHFQPKGRSIPPEPWLGPPEGRRRMGRMFALSQIASLQIYTQDKGEPGSEWLLPNIVGAVGTVGTKLKKSALNALEKEWKEWGERR